MNYLDPSSHWRELAEVRTVLTELTHQAGKVAERGGRVWRIQNPEFMDAYEAAVTKLKAVRDELRRLAGGGV